MGNIWNMKMSNNMRTNLRCIMSSNMRGNVRYMNINIKLSMRSFIRKNIE